MDERDLNARSRRARVLRAADVIPPFDREDSRPSKGDRKGDQSGLSKPGDAGADGAGHGADQAGSPGAAANPARRPPSKPSEIPAYDLAENILAEHRRTAAGRRRAPGRPNGGPVASSESPRPQPLTTGQSSGEILELQRVVAEIVARDIERLCKRASR